jgi:environmental stress-induced protein Ves
VSTAPHATRRPEGLIDSKSSLHTVRLQDAAAQPWRNGGGMTRELLAWPAPPTQVADNAAWAVRVSVADITQDGPFSAFPGIDRGFTVLEGAGVVLRLRGADLRLTADSDPLAFDGADAPGCRLIQGPTRDLNLMVRQSAGRAWMQRAVPEQPWQTDARWAWRGVYSHGPARVATANGHLDLQAGTLLWSDAGFVRAPAAHLTAPWCLTEGTQVWWLGLLTPDPAEEDA